MSASEKLKALGDGLPRERIAEHIMAEGWNPDLATPQKLEEVSRELRLDAYDAALPQIVAVVEAAEAMQTNYRAEPDSEYRIRFWQAWDEFSTALTALEEALS